MTAPRLAGKPASTPTRVRGLFVTGTDTGAGKTLVSAAIVRALVTRGVRVGVYKPAETGCRTRDGATAATLVGEDGELLAAAAGQPPPSYGGAEVSSYLLRQPAAPLVAAETEGTRIDPARMVADFERIAASSDFVVVEGAGGLLVPIAEGFTYRELARELGLPLLCVVASRLGCINHAMLTIEAIEAAGLELRGYVVNQSSGDASSALAANSNRRTIARFSDRDSTRDLGLFPFVPEADRGDFDALARLAEASIDINAIGGSVSSPSLKNPLPSSGTDLRVDLFVCATSK